MQACFLSGLLVVPSVWPSCLFLHAAQVSDALIKLGSDNGGLLPDVHCIVNKEKPSASADVCGVAYTVKVPVLS